MKGVITYKSHGLRFFDAGANMNGEFVLQRFSLSYVFSGLYSYLFGLNISWTPFSLFILKVYFVYYLYSRKSIFPYVEPGIDFVRKFYLTNDTFADLLEFVDKKNKLRRKLLD